MVKLIKLVKLDDPAAQEAMENGRLPGTEPSELTGTFNKEAAKVHAAPGASAVAAS